MKAAVWSDVRNCLLASHCSGGAENLRDPSFREKSENFEDFGWFGEWIQDDVLSICTNAVTRKASETVKLRSPLHSGKMNRSDHVSAPVVERMVPITNNLSAATKNRAPHFQDFAFFC
jgi:hypothetical protein